MITFEQWSTSWNIYIQSFSYSTAVFYNTFLTQCHLVKYKMPIWNSEIAIVLWGGLNTYTDHFNYVPIKYTAFSQPLRGWYFHLFQSYLFDYFFFLFWALQPEQSHFFFDSNTKNLPLVVCESRVFAGLPAWVHFQLPRYRLAFPPSSTSFQDWPSPEGRWRFQLYALTNSTLSLTGGHLGIPCSIRGFQFTERKKQLKFWYYWEGGKDLQPLYNSDISRFTSQRNDNFVCGLTLTSAFHLAAPCYRPSLNLLFQHKHFLEFPPCFFVCLSFSIFQSHSELPFHFPHSTPSPLCKMLLLQPLDQWGLKVV